jgi:hypothetical protein
MATTYTFRNVINPGDPTFNQLLGINNGGVIAGYFGSGAPGHPNQGYTTTLTNLTSFTSENFPGTVQTQVIGLNNRGATVGFYSGTNMGVGMDANYGFWSPGPHLFTSVQDPLTPPASTALPTNNLLGINDNGLAVGFYNDKNGISHGYTFNTKTSTFSKPINVAAGVSTTTAGINNAGDIVGFSTTNGGMTFSGFEKVGASFMTLNDPGMVSTQLLGINNNGLAVGDAVGPKGGMFGVTWSATGGWTNYHVGINPSGVFATTFNGVNDLGDIVGFYVNKMGNTIGLLATPTTAPSDAETGATAQSFDAYSLLAPDAGIPSSLHQETTHVNHALNVAVGSHEGRW